MIYTIFITLTDNRQYFLTAVA